MRKARPRRDIRRSSVEMRSYAGKNEPKNRYIMVKGYLAGRDYFNIFLAHELKGACLEILGRDDSPATRRPNANVLAKKVWYGK